MAPDQFQKYWDLHQSRLLQEYQSGRQAFIPYLLPAQALELDITAVMKLLEGRIGQELLQQALDPQHTIPSPLANQTSTRWMRSTNMVGINVRTIQSFWNVIPYCLTLPAANQSIHLLPIWEPGVVASLYGMASWNINPEFFSEALYQEVPALDTVEKQLKAVVNLLHSDGRAVGMDVIPHTDRYSEIVLANPGHFEWLQRRDELITSHRANLHQEVEQNIWRFLQNEGPASEKVTLPSSPEEFFAPSYPEAKRIKILFGQPQDYHGRGTRRGMLVKHLYEDGLEPIPATMAPPYRGLEVDTDEQAKSVDSEGRIWREYKIQEPQEMSRVFGPLARYKLYERLDDNENWAIDFSRPRVATWNYVCQHFDLIQQTYNFDFMRGDMSHVQMRPDGVPLEVDEYYDLHKAVGTHIKKKKPYFAYFAETFLTGPNFMAYGNEPDHLEQADADATLGDLQSMVCGEEKFMANFRWYLDLLEGRRFAPSFTVMTGDKDDPRFDKYYLHGNEARLFISLFLTDMPSYTGLGFACRDPHPEPAPNEHYTKLYVFKINDGPKAVKGSYVFGSNVELFYRISRMRELSAVLLPEINNAATHWLLFPDPTGGDKAIAWTQKDRTGYLFVVNMDGKQAIQNIKIPISNFLKQRQAVFIFSTHADKEKAPLLPSNGRYFQIDELLAGEGRVFRLIK